WEREHPEYRRIEQRDWDHPEPREWIENVERVVTATRGDVVLVGHSLGCITIAKWGAKRGVTNVIGALLVAPSDVEAGTAPQEVRSFAPIPATRLPFRSIVVTSTNDELITLSRAEQLARNWG